MATDLPLLFALRNPTDQQEDEGLAWIWKPAQHDGGVGRSLSGATSTIIHSAPRYLWWTGPG